METQLQANNIIKVYGKSDFAFKALDDVSISINKGDSVAILGKSGSGKSTLMHILSALDTPTQGQVMLQGQDIASLSESTKNKIRNYEFGFVFQQFFLLPQQSVLENVVLPLKIMGIGIRDRNKTGLEILEKVGLKDKARNKAVNLSGGQKQRTAIARALVTKPSIIFADEPTGNLDTETGKQVIDLLFEFNTNNNVTLVIVTHDKELAARCDKQIEIKDGAVINRS